MPNWCNNHITVRGKDAAEITRLADAFDSGGLCAAVIPIPECLEQADASNSGGEHAEQYIKMQEDNRAATGYSSWYDFCVDKWGTKWDISTQEEADREQFVFSGQFDSAWSPPIGIAEELTRLGFHVVLHYNEPGMAYVGCYDSEDGDNYIEYGGYDSSTVRDHIGQDLDDFWCISENMAEYEDENTEELTKWIKDGAESKEESAE